MSIITTPNPDVVIVEVADRVQELELSHVSHIEFKYPNPLRPARVLVTCHGITLRFDYMLTLSATDDYKKLRDLWLAHRQRVPDEQFDS